MAAPGLSALGTGVTFLPMMLMGVALTPFSARIAEKLGSRVLVTTGLALMATGLVFLAIVPASTPVGSIRADGPRRSGRASDNASGHRGSAK